MLIEKAGLKEKISLCVKSFSKVQQFVFLIQNTTIAGLRTRE